MSALQACHRVRRGNGALASACPCRARHVFATARDARCFAERQKAFGGPLHPRMRTNNSAESTTVTSSELAHPSRFEKTTNTLHVAPIYLPACHLPLAFHDGRASVKESRHLTP